MNSPVGLWKENNFFHIFFWDHALYIHYHLFRSSSNEDVFYIAFSSKEIIFNNVKKHIFQLLCWLFCLFRLSFIFPNFSGADVCNKMRDKKLHLLILVDPSWPQLDLKDHIWKNLLQSIDAQSNRPPPWAAFAAKNLPLS